MKSDELKRPQDVVRVRTSDPKEMLGKYLYKRVLRTWMEDFADATTGEVISIERSEIVCERGLVTQDKLQQIMFAIQSGSIQDVEVCDMDIAVIDGTEPNYMIPYNVELIYGLDRRERIVCHAHTIPQAITIATEFGQVYRGLGGFVRCNRAVAVDARIIEDTHECIPESERKEPGEYMDRFKVTVRSEWVEDGKLKHIDTHYIVAAKDVGEAKGRVTLMLEIERAKAEKSNTLSEFEDDRTCTVRKAVPFEVDCIVPKAFSELYKQ